MAIDVCVDGRYEGDVFESLDLEGAVKQNEVLGSGGVSDNHASGYAETRR